MPNLSSRIKERRRILGMNADEVANAVGVSRATLYRYEAGEVGKIPTKVLQPLAKILQTTPAYLLGLDAVQEQEETKAEETDKNMYPVSGNIVYLPVIGVVRAGSGGITFDDVLGQEFVERDTIKGHSPSEFFWSRVKGDSMEPRLFENDLVLVRKQTSVDSGDYAVVLVDDEEGVVKRVTYDEHSITLNSQNSKYAPRTFTGKEVLRVRVVGKVIKSMSSF